MIFKINHKINEYNFSFVNKRYMRLGLNALEIYIKKGKSFPYTFIFLLLLIYYVLSKYLNKFSPNNH